MFSVDTQLIIHVAVGHRLYFMIRLQIHMFVCLQLPENATATEVIRAWAARLKGICVCEVCCALVRMCYALTANKFVDVFCHLQKNRDSIRVVYTTYATTNFVCRTFVCDFLWGDS